MGTEADRDSGKGLFFPEKHSSIPSSDSWFVTIRNSVCLAPCPWFTTVTFQRLWVPRLAGSVAALHEIAMAIFLVALLS